MNINVNRFWMERVHHRPRDHGSRPSLFFHLKPFPNRKWRAFLAFVSVLRRLICVSIQSSLKWPVARFLLVWTLSSKKKFFLLGSITLTKLSNHRCLFLVLRHSVRCHSIQCHINHCHRPPCVCPIKWDPTRGHFRGLQVHIQLLLAPRFLLVVKEGPNTANGPIKNRKFRNRPQRDPGRVGGSRPTKSTRKHSSTGNGCPSFNTFRSFRFGSIGNLFGKKLHFPESRFTEEPFFLNSIFRSSALAFNKSSMANGKWDSIPQHLSNYIIL